MMKFRNNYHVPAGQVVLVDTPQGQVTYRGGQFVPPEHLAHATFKQDSKKGGQGNEGASKDNIGFNWAEMAENFKSVNISDNNKLNQASFSISDFLSIPIRTSSNKITAAARFGTEFALANLFQSLPGLKQITKDSQVKINLSDMRDIVPDLKVVDGKSFQQIGQLDFDNETLNIWQFGQDSREIFSNCAKLVSFKIGLLLIHALHTTIEEQVKKIPEMQKYIKNYQTTMQQLISDEYKKTNKPIKIGQNQELDDIKEKLEQTEQSLQSIVILDNLLKELKDIVYKEKGIDEHIQSHLEEEGNKIGLGLYEQFAKALADANLYSFGRGKTFESGFEQVSSKHPETMTKIKSIISFLNQEQN